MNEKGLRAVRRGVTACVLGAFMAIAAGTSFGASSALAEEDTARSLDASALSEKLREHFRAEQFDDALLTLKTLCAESDNEDCVFNLAVVHQALEHCSESDRYYRQYLRLFPAGVNKSAAQNSLKYLGTQCKFPSGRTEAPQASPSEEPNPVSLHKLQAAKPMPAQSLLSTATATIPLPLRPPPPSVSSVPISKTEGFAAPLPAPLSSQKPGAGAAVLLTISGMATLTTAMAGVGFVSAKEKTASSKSDYFDSEKNSFAREKMYQTIGLISGATAIASLGAGLLVWKLQPTESPMALELEATLPDLSGHGGLLFRGHF